MRAVGYMGCAGAVLLLAACDVDRQMRVKVSDVDDDGGKYAVVDRLECPEREGDLRLTFVAADGRSCGYRTRRGGEVELRLTALNGLTPDAVLAPIEAELEPLVPGAPAADPAHPPEPPHAPEAPHAGDGEEHVSVAGVVDIRTRGDQATIRLPGVSIDANDKSAHVRVKDSDGERVVVKAEDKAARVRAHSDADGDLKSTFVLASETPGPQGWRVAGYEARGPVRGPLVIGVGKVKDEHDDAMDDMEDLVRQNVRR